MAEWVVDSVEYEANVVGGNLQNHKVEVSARRERKNKYTVCVDLRPPGDLRPIVSGSALRDASLHREFSTVEQALSAGFRALYRRLNNNGKNTLEGLEQRYTHWAYLREDGTTDWEYMSKLSEKERSEKMSKPLKYNPPTSEAIKSNDRSKQLGRAFRMETELGGLDEDEGTVNVRGRSDEHDGERQAKKGLNRFLQTRGMGPDAGEGSQTEEPKEEISVPGKKGPQSGGTLARDEMASPVETPRKPFPG